MCLVTVRCLWARALIPAAAALLYGCGEVRSDPLSPVSAGQRFVVTVDRVKDGDSFLARHPSGSVEVRLFGIDAPEKRQPYARESRDAARRLLAGKSVTLLVRDQDRFGRVVAWAHVDDQKESINQQLVASGAAWVYQRYSQDKALMAAEEQARSQRRGLWAQAGTPVPPWTWRNNNK